MKWEHYRELSPEKKEEYQFRFGVKPHINIWGFYLLLIVFIQTSLLVLMMYFLAVKDVAFASVKADAELLFQRSLVLSRFGLWLALPIVIVDVLSLQIGRASCRERV